MSNTYFNSRGGSRPWKRLRAQVIREEPQCWLRLPGCTGVSTTADHVIPRAIRPDLVMVRSNLHGACRSCNLKRGKKTVPAARRNKQQSSVKALAFFD